ncbi:MAG: hypothetical protein KDB27_13685 [Planctomycetales bacterium]|nr:hypothetical protein [Planctomycetales bacterium]
MAKRENQGLHIALISFVILSVLLIVTTYYFWAKSRDLDSQVITQKNAATDANARMNTAVMESERLKAFMGYSPEITVDDIESEFNKNMLTYAGDSLPEVNRNYKDLPAHLMASIQERYKRISDLDSEKQTLQAEFARQKEELQKALSEANAELAKKESNVEQIDQTAKAQDAKLTAQLAQQAKKFGDQIAQLDSTIAELRTENETLTREKADLTIILQDREDKIAQLTNENNFDKPDGKIRFVNTKMRTVYLNLGAADGLRRQVTFSVFGSDVNNLYKEHPKGKIEVIRVLGAHESEARIVDDYIDDPILKGDVVYTPIWNANSALRFALLGFLDIDGDGRDDRQRVKAMIARSNGKVDAEDVGGEIQGRITESTRYLVVDGDAPELTGDDVANIRTAQSQMRNEAASKGVEVIELDRLLEFMGFNGDKRVIPLGPRANSIDFPAKPLDGVTKRISPAKKNSQFRSRKAPVSGSAYSSAP